MPKPKRSDFERSVSRVEDRAGRSWTVTVTTIEENEELEPWRTMTGDERVALIGECVLDGLRLEGKLDIPRLRRIHRVLERESRARPAPNINEAANRRGRKSTR